MELKSSNELFECKSCDYVTNKKFNYDKHVLTTKHKNSILGIKRNDDFSCTKCGKEYKTQSGNWKHEKTCKVSDPDVMQKLIDENKELSRIVVYQQRFIVGGMR